MTMFHRICKFTRFGQDIVIKLGNRFAAVVLFRLENHTG